MPRVLIAVDLAGVTTGEAVATVTQLMKHVEWPEEVETVEVGEVEEEEVDG